LKPRYKAQKTYLQGWWVIRIAGRHRHLVIASDLTEEAAKAKAAELNA
jgi:hypothetical protein